MKKIFVILPLLALLFLSCKKKEAPGYVRFVFEHYWGDSLVDYHGKEYVTEVGNIVTIEDLEYFISDLAISGADYVEFNSPEIRYLSFDSAYSQFLTTNPVKPGAYSRISFIFGIDSNRNISNTFVNSPEKDMFWPSTMGGGYHYMKLDGKWRNPDEADMQGFGLHLGALEVTILDTIRNNKDSIIRIDSYVEKYHKNFKVFVNRDFQVRESEITTVKIKFDLKEWTQDPYIWDFNIHGNAIMSNERAMDTLAKNGYNAFK